jgi:V/A-type H+-transporting ATPase subunit E
MGLQEVKDEILNEAEQKASRIKEEGDTEAEEIIADAEARAEKIKEENREKIEKEKEALEKKKVSKAEMDAKKEVQEAKQESVEKAFEAFSDELYELSDDQLKKFVESEMEEANFEVETVRGSEEFEEFVDEDFEEMDGKGLILESSDGKKSLNLTFDRIIEDFRRNHRGETAKILFDEVEE